MLALFPLQLIVYPEEKLSLHIFEERYQELIADCEDKQMHFGIPAYINKKMEYGTEVVLEKVVNKYPNGQRDIICKGLRIFRINNFYKRAPGKLYAGGIVDFLDNNNKTEKDLQEELLKNIAKLYMELTLDKPPVFKTPLISYQVAHKVGLSLQQEYHLLTLRSELERLHCLIGHLRITIPVVREMNRTKEVIKMNGHFKNFDPLDFENVEL